MCVTLFIYSFLIIILLRKAENNGKYKYRYFESLIKGGVLGVGELLDSVLVVGESLEDTDGIAGGAW